MPLTGPQQRKCQKRHERQVPPPGAHHYLVRALAGSMLLIGPCEQFTAGDTGPEALFGPSPALPNMGLGGEHVGMARAVQLIGAWHQGAITPSAIHTTPLSLCRSRRPAASAAAARADLSHSIHQEAQGPGTCK